MPEHLKEFIASYATRKKRYKMFPESSPAIIQDGRHY